MATLKEILKSSKEISFDRFVTPTFYLKGRDKMTLEITKTSLLIWEHKTGTAKPVIVTELSFKEYGTLDDIAKALISSSEKYSFSYAASFIASEPSWVLLPVKGLDIRESSPIFRSSFFSAKAMMYWVRLYFIRVMTANPKDVGMGEEFGAIGGIDDPSDEGTINFAQEVFTDILASSGFGDPRPQHMSLWIAYNLIDTRRLYEMAAELLGQSTMTYGTQNELIVESGQAGSLRMNIGDIFSTNQEVMDNFNQGEQYWRLGADNILGDAKSFWYRLQLWVRQQLEELFGDYSFRKDTIMIGDMNLVKDTNFYAYFDSYPYTISPLTRNILSSGQGNSELSSSGSY